MRVRAAPCWCDLCTFLLIIEWPVVTSRRLGLRFNEESIVGQFVELRPGVVGRPFGVSWVDFASGSGALRRLWEEYILKDRPDSLEIRLHALNQLWSGLNWRRAGRDCQEYDEPEGDRESTGGRSLHPGHCHAAKPPSQTLHDMDCDDEPKDSFRNFRRRS